MTKRIPQSELPKSVKNVLSYGGAAARQGRGLSPRGNFPRQMPNPKNAADQPMLNKQQQTDLFVRQLGQSASQSQYPTRGFGQEFSRLLNASQIRLPKRLRSDLMGRVDPAYLPSDYNYGTPVSENWSKRSWQFENYGDRAARLYPRGQPGAVRNEMTQRYLTFLDTGRMPPAGPVDYGAWRERYGGGNRYNPNYPLDDEEI